MTSVFVADGGSLSFPLRWPSCRSWFSKPRYCYEPRFYYATKTVQYFCRCWLLSWWWCWLLLLLLLLSSRLLRHRHPPPPVDNPPIDSGVVLPRLNEILGEGQFFWSSRIDHIEIMSSHFQRILSLSPPQHLFIHRLHLVELANQSNAPAALVHSNILGEVVALPIVDGCFPSFWESPQTGFSPSTQASNCIGRKRRNAGRFPWVNRWRARCWLGWWLLGGRWGTRWLGRWLGRWLLGRSSGRWLFGRRSRWIFIPPCRRGSIRGRMWCRRGRRGFINLAGQVLQASKNETLTFNQGLLISLLNRIALMERCCEICNEPL